MDDPLLTKEEVAAHLRVSRRSVERLITEGELSVIKGKGRNGSVRIRQSEYEALLTRRTKTATVDVTASEER